MDIPPYPSLFPQGRVVTGKMTPETPSHMPIYSADCLSSQGTTTADPSLITIFVVITG